jgi:hypothetical protein
LGLREPTLLVSQEDEMELKRDQRKDVLKVHIRRDLTVDNEVVNVRRSTGDEIEWRTDELPVTIDFGSNSPFADNCFDVVPGQATRSGSVVNPEIRDYGYSINSKALAMSADPGVSVKP